MKQDIEMNLFKLERNNMITAATSLLATSNYAKQAFLCSDFFKEILRELYSVIDLLTLNSD